MLYFHANAKRIVVPPAGAMREHQSLIRHQSVGAGPSQGIICAAEAWQVVRMPRWPLGNTSLTSIVIPAGLEAFRTAVLTMHPVSKGVTHTTPEPPIAPVQHCELPPGRLPQLLPPHVPQDAAQHAWPD